MIRRMVAWFTLRKMIRAGLVENIDGTYWPTPVGWDLLREVEGFTLDHPVFGDVRRPGTLIPEPGRVAFIGYGVAEVFDFEAPGMGGREDDAGTTR